MKPYLKSHAEGALLSIKAIPRASRNEIGEAVGAELKIKVTAPPVDSAANQALVELISEKLGCSKSSILLIRGQTTRHKVFLLRGVTPEEAESRLR